MSGSKGDRISEASEGQADGGTAGARAITFPTPHHRNNLSLLSSALAQATPLPLHQPNAPSVGWSWAIRFG
jgi:hypothetical protein